MKNSKWVEDKKTANDGIESVVRRYAVIAEQIKELEDEKRDLKGAIENQLAHAGVKQATFGEFEVSQSDCSRENFNLKEACRVLNKSLLAPFISETAYTQLRVKRLAGGK